MSIGYANICSSVQDHRQKFKCLYIKIRFWKNKWEQWNLQKGSLCYKIEFEEDNIWRHLKQLIRSSSSEAVYQKLTSSEVEDHQKLKIIRSWRREALEFVNCCYSHAYDCRRNGSLEQRLIQRNLKALDTYPLKNAEKRT